MNKKEQAEEKILIKKEVKFRVGMGEPKQKIFEDMSKSFKDVMTIANQLELTPSVKMKQKYRLYNYGLAVMLAVAWGLDFILLGRVEWDSVHFVIAINTSLNVALDLVFLVGVLMYRTEIYSWISSRAVLSVVTIMVSFYHFGFSSVDVLHYISLGLIVATFILGMLLGVKLCPPRIPKTIEIKVDEKEKINKTIHVFAD